MAKKKCELCDRVARMFCESDQASLCWDCDGKVHGANFLVAKHTRCLLCNVCQSPTPWKASGLRFGPTVSICESCLARTNNSVAGSSNQNLKKEINSNNNDDCEEGEEEAEKQVVPWSAAPVMSSSSSSVSSGEESFSGDGGLVVKRTRRDMDLDYSDGGDTSLTSSLSLKTAKKRRYLSR
ncbi:hypothetical protein F2Q70_00004951 [Brassica cretica]|uniref:B box-type domain-containing protein n=1 Tax=Brassica cretica TaxID=69181 RepID=A0A8S9IZQ1_BRACR|nr:hypothetical protein F2Q70_00004951 [Brassica cretica]